MEPVKQVSSESSLPSNKGNNSLILLFSLLAIALISGALGYYLGSSQNPSSTVTGNTPTPTGTVQVTPSVTVVKQALSDALVKNCIDSRINSSDLPFTLSQQFVKKFTITDTFDCPKSEDGSYKNSYVFGSFKETGEKVSSVYFFHENSIFDGYGNPLDQLSAYSSTTLDGKTIFYQIQEPGPHGISTYGVYIIVFAQKQDAITGTVARVLRHNALHDAELINLVKKYGTKTPNSTDIALPEYILDSSKKSQFMQEIQNALPKNASFVQMVKDAEDDLKGVVF